MVGQNIAIIYCERLKIVERDDLSFSGYTSGSNHLYSLLV